MLQPIASSDSCLMVVPSSPHHVEPPQVNALHNLLDVGTPTGCAQHGAALRACTTMSHTGHNRCGARLRRGAVAWIMQVDTRSMVSYNDTNDTIDLSLASVSESNVPLEPNSVLCAPQTTTLLCQLPTTNCMSRARQHTLRWMPSTF